MANTSKVAVTLAILVFLQVSCSAFARRYVDGKLDGGTSAVMTANGFQKGQDGGGPSECDSKYHDDNEMVVALSTQWYDHGHRCFKMISITSTRTGRTVEAKVVDECDSTRDCPDNDVDASVAVWKALGLDTNIGETPVTWSDA
jgi:hypothetical protein